MKILLSIIISCFLITGYSSMSIAGNKRMVEENVEELDELNKKAVKQIPDLPKKGQVDMKTDVTYEKEEPVFNLRYKKITSEKEGKINFGTNQVKKTTKKSLSEETNDKND